MFVSRALDPEFVFHFDVIRQCGGLPATDSDSVLNSRKDGTLTLSLSFSASSVFLRIPNSVCWRICLVCCPLFCYFAGEPFVRLGMAAGVYPPVVRIPQYAVFIVNVSDRLPSICGSASSKDSAWLTKAVYALSFSQ